MADLTKDEIAKQQYRSMVDRVNRMRDDGKLPGEPRRPVGAIVETPVPRPLSASPAPSLPTREEIARVIDETAECHSENRMDRAFLDNSEEIADRILALFAQPQEKKP